MGKWMFDRHVREFWPERDLKKYPVWFTNFSHSFPPWTPLFEWTWCFNSTHGHMYGVNEAWIPESTASDWRASKGMVLVTAQPIKDKDEIEFRKKKFFDFIKNDFGPNYDAKWEDSKTDMKARYNKIKEFDYQNSSNYEVYKIFNMAIETHRKMWEEHFYFMYALFGSYWEFEDLSKEYVGLTDTMTDWHKLVRGYDNMLLRQDKAMWHLRNKAIEYGIDDIIADTPPEKVIEVLKGSEKGKQWVDVDLHEFMHVLEYGWRMVRMMEFIEPCWWEAPEKAMVHIQQYLLEDREVRPFPLDAIRERLVAEREEIEKEVVAKAEANGCPDMEWFKILLKLSQKCSSFSESHDFVYEHRCFSAFRYCMLQIADRLVKHGTIAERDDIFFFIPDELQSMICNPDSYDNAFIARDRRQEWVANGENVSRAPIVARDPNMQPHEAGAYMKAARNPIITKITIGEFVEPDPSTGAILFGNPASPGVVEGKACVVVKPADITKIKPGDIMVCPAFQSGFTPVLPLITGIVTNGGGSLSHGAINGREWDIPVVANCIQGTQLIKDGQKIRVDGFKGLVFDAEG